MPSLEIISLIVFVIVIGGLLLKDRKNIKFQYGLIIRRWNKGLEFIDGLVNRHYRLMKFLGNVGVLLSILASVIGIVSIIILTIKLQQSFALVVPTVGGYHIPGPVVSIPFWYWLLALFIIGSSHELSHAIFMRLEKVPVKNFGVLMLLLYPISAFVEPDQKKIQKLQFFKKLRIFAAGSFANFITAVLAIGLFVSGMFLFNALTDNIGVKIESLAKDSPAETVHLQGTIIEVNGKIVRSVVDYVKILNGTKANDIINITTDEGRYQLALGKNPTNANRTYIGMTVRNSYSYDVLGLAGTVPSNALKIFFAVMSFLNWLFMLSIGIGIANSLPWKPFDGGLIYEEIFKRFFGGRGAVLIKITTVAVIVLFLFNLLIIPWLRSII